MRRGTSLVEALVFFAVGAGILVLLAQLAVRLTRHDTWNASRLSSVESLVMAFEQIQVDLACSASGAVSPSGEGLSIERARAADGGATEAIVYERGASRTLTRAGRPMYASKLDEARFDWADPGAALLTVHLVSSGDRVERSGTVQNSPLALDAKLQVTGKARREEFAGWVDGE